MKPFSKELPPEEPGKFQQFVAALIINVATLTYGMTLGWSSPTAPILMSNDPPVGTEAMTSDQISWLNGIVCLGALSGLPFCSYLSEKFGRKICGCLILIPLGGCWLLKLIAVNYPMLLIARLLAGIGGSMSFFLIPIYVTEISANSIRGQLGSFLVFAVNIGLVFGYIIGASLSYRLFAAVSLLAPIIFFFGFLFMPETPVYLVRKNRLAEAAKSLIWLKNHDNEAVERELLHLEKLVKNTSNNDPSKTVGFKDLFRDRGTIKGLVIALGLLIGQQLCGISAIAMNAAEIFTLAGSSMSPNTAAIVFGCIQVVGSGLSTVMMERAGRRSLILISCAGMTICHFVLGSFLFLMGIGYKVEPFAWIPVVALSFYAISYCLGMGPAPFVVGTEVFNSDISGFANSISMVVLWIFAFLVTKFFPFFVDILGMAGCFFFFSSCCACTYLFTFFLVPETKGKAIELIFAELNGFPNNYERGYVKTSIEIIGRKRSTISNV